MSQPLKDQIVNSLDNLSDSEQQRMLGFIEALAAADLDHISGQSLLCIVGLIPTNDLALMAEAIKEGCEGIDTSEWQLPVRLSPPRGVSAQ